MLNWAGDVRHPAFTPCLKRESIQLLIFEYDVSSMFSHIPLLT